MYRNFLNCDQCGHIFKITIDQSTPDDEKPMQLQEKSDNLVLPNVPAVDITSLLHILTVGYLPYQELVYSV